MNRPKKPTKGCTRFYARRINELHDQLDIKLQELQELHTNNSALKLKEAVLQRSIAEQGDNLHYVALAALGAVEAGQRTDVAVQVASCLLQDFEAFQLLKAASSDSEELPQQHEELYTSQCLRAAVTPEAVQRLRSSTAADRCRMTRDIVMRLGFHMCMRRPQQQQQQQQPPPPPPWPAAPAPAAAALRPGHSGSTASDASAIEHSQALALQQQQQQQQALQPQRLLQRQLEDVVDDYVQLLMLMSVASFVAAQRLCYVNLETEEPQTPPPGHWWHLVQQLELQPEQLAQLRICFDMYTTICSPLLERVHALTDEMQSLMSAPPPAASPDDAEAAVAAAAHAAAAASPAAAAAAAGISGAQQPPTLQHLLQPPGSARSADTGSSGPSSSHSTGGSSGSRTSSQARRRAAVHAWQSFGLPQEAGCLDMESMQRLDEILLELEPCLDKVAQRSRILTFQVINILDKLQIAKAALNAFPWIVNVVQICRAAVHLGPEQPQH